MGINNPTVSLDISSTNALKIPVGRTLERPYSNDENIHAGYIRYNIEQHTYEGFGSGNAWGTLGGVKDVDQDTYIIAESSAGVDNDDLQFYTAGVQRLEISNTGDFSLNANNVFINSANSLDLSATTIISISPEIKTNKIYANTFDGTFGYFANIVTNGINATGLITSYGGINVYGGMNLQNKDITSVNRITANTFSGGTYSSGSINGSVTIGSRTATDINTAITNNANAISANTGNITNNTNAISANIGNITNNTNAIFANTGNITNNANAISANTVNITNNANAISANTVNITNNANDIGSIANNIASIQGRQDTLFGFESGTYAPYSSNYVGTHSVNNRITGGLEIIGSALYVSATVASSHSGSYGIPISIFSFGGILSAGVYSHSDDRLKHNEQDITNGLDIIRQLKPQVYNKTLYRKSAHFNGVLTDDHYIEAGLIAQDILNINDLSYCLWGGDYTDSSGVFHEETYGLKYDNIYAYNIAATKELDEEVQKLKKENKIFKSTLNSLLLDLGIEPVSL